MAKIQQLAKLPLWEICFYALVWTTAVFYSIYCVYLVTNNWFENTSTIVTSVGTLLLYILHFGVLQLFVHLFKRLFTFLVFNESYDDPYHDFDTGWSFVQRKMDVSDEEWKMWIPCIFKLAPWIIVQVFVSQCLKRLCHNTVVLCNWYIFVSIAFLWYHFGLLSTFCTLLLPFTSCLLTSLRSKAISWIVHSMTLCLIYWAKTSNIVFRDWLQLKDEQFFMLTTAICWIQLRSISYSIDSIESYIHDNIWSFLKDLSQNIAYCLYLPTLFLGPVILYEQFTDGLKEPFTKWTVHKILKTLGNIARYFFWMFVTHLSMHYVYFNALNYQPKLVLTLRPWAFYGYGYCMGQYFLNKYVVVYGLTSTICRAEDIDAPPQPKCIGRIHLYSDMWKHFDRGLYKFLLRYIYVPLNPKSRFGKFAASAICFTFIYLWHGMHLFIFIWSFLNFNGILIEMIAKSCSSYFYKNVLRDCMNLRNKRRFECAIASPLLALSAVSNFYFFAGEEIGHMFAFRTLQESWEVNLMLLFILYCCCQVSTEAKQYEQVNVRKRNEAQGLKKD